MNFIAIDFETANEKRDSACSIGLTVVKNNQIIEQKYYLIKPNELRFAPINISIHGIRASDVKNAKTFDQLWPELLPYFTNNIIMAHNAAFDLSVLRHTLDAYHIPYPNCRYGCTMILSRNFFPHLENAKLNTVNHHLGLEFNHHHASADAHACANIVLKMQEKLQCADLEELCQMAGLKLGTLHDAGYIPAKKLKKTVTSKRNFTPSPLPFISSKSDVFKHKTVVFTGTLKSMSRLSATQLISQLGGTVGSSVTRKTDFLIVSHPAVYELQPHEMSTKLKKAIELIYKGQAIQILNESEFLEQLTK